MTQASTALVTEPKQQYAQIQDYLISKQRVIAQILPKYLDTERMIRAALSASSRNPTLLKCTPQSWLMALMDCAFYGLEPNAVLGHAYLIPFQNKKLKHQPHEVLFLPGYKGLISLACEYGGFDDIDARMVYANEIKEGRFEEIPEDPARPFRHRPYYQEDVRGPVAGAYAVGWRGIDKRPRFKFLTVEEIELFRGRSRAAQAGPWVTDWNAMAMKTCVRRLLALAQLKPGNKLTTALEQENALEQDETVMRAQDWRVDDGPSSGGHSRTDDLTQRLEKRAGRAEPPTVQPEPDPEPASGEQQGDLFVP